MKSLVPCGYLDVLAIFRAGNVLPAIYREERHSLTRPDFEHAERRLGILEA